MILKNFRGYFYFSFCVFYFFFFLVSALDNLFSV